MPTHASAPTRQGPAPRKSEEVYSLLRKKIILSAIKDGQPITEMEIAESMACSQGTVREALLRLQEEGLVVRQGYRGSVVSPISANEAQAFLSLRAQLESEALIHSMPLVTPQDIQSLADLVAQMEAAAAKGDEYGLFELDQRFHTHIFQIAQMPALVPVLVRCSLYNHRNKISLSNAPRTLLETAQRHRAIVQALASADVAQAQKVLRHHIQSVAGEPADLPDPSSGAPVTDPHQQRIVERVAREDAGLPDFTQLPRAQALAQVERVNARWNQNIDAGAFDIRTSEIPAPASSGAQARTLGIVRITHRTNHRHEAGSLVYLHGGGWNFCSNQTHLGAMSRLAQLTGCTVLGVDYGLAPDHPFPQGLNDCSWAWRWLRSTTPPQGRWYLAGDSAGANLALAMMLDLRSLGEPPPSAALLFYGVYSANHDTPSHRICGSGKYGLSTARMAWYRANYLSGAATSPDHPRVSPLNADLNGLPPLFLNAASLDPLHDDTTALIQKLSTTNTPFEFHRYDGVVHGFMQMSDELPKAVQAFQDAAAFLRVRQQQQQPSDFTPTSNEGDTP